MKVLVSGASGFIGRALSACLDSLGHEVTPVVRKPSAIRGECVVINQVNWARALVGCTSVIHLAARVHVMSDTCPEPLQEFRRVNVEGTLNLARQAAASGVKRFIFLSSIKVNGECTESGRAFHAEDEPAPKDPYAISKYEAELALLKIASETGMEVVIIRSPLVYGPGVKANFQSMMRWLTWGVPLPLATFTDNRRSLVALDNLIDLIRVCIHHPNAANQIFLVSDGEDLSTAELLKRMGEAQGTPARLFYVPASVLRLGVSLLGKQNVYQRLCGSLQVDIDKTRQLLGWVPPIPVDEGLRRAALRA